MTEDVFVLLVIVILFGLCALVKEHSDREWQKIREEMRADHERKLSAAIKHFNEQYRKVKKHANS